MADIFISHAVVDKPLAEALLTFLKEAIGVPAKSIFCSSVGGHDIPLTANFNDYMKDQIQSPQLVIALMTPRYMESWFCLMELGAAWSQSAKTLPIVVPPNDFSSVSSTIGLKQGWSIDNHAKLTDLREMIKALDLKLEHRTEHDWEKKKTLWKSDLRVILKKLKNAQNVPAEQHEALKVKHAEVEKERDSLSDLYQEAKEEIEVVLKLKDKDAVKAHKKAKAGKDPDAELADLIDAVATFKPKWMTDSFFIDQLIMDHYRKASTIDWMDYDAKRMTEQAVQSNLLTEDPGFPADWGGKLKPLRKAIAVVEAFLSDNGDLVDGPTDATDREFWEHHL